MLPPVFRPREAFEKVRGSRDCELKPDGLWVTGTTAGLAFPTVAIVGTRSATPYGKRLATEFARALGAAGCTIISGLALGIDAAAHNGALDASAPTIGVLGGGHERFFPKRNTELAERIVASGGAVLSPFAPEVVPRPPYFLERNGIVAALADAVLVIEAPSRSGALNTAHWGAARIPVLAVPGDVDRAHVAGCHALIRDGAILARNADDVLEVLNVPAPAPRTKAHRIDDPMVKRLVAVLSSGECDLDRIVAQLAMPTPAVLALLATLELNGAVERRGARWSMV